MADLWQVHIIGPDEYPTEWQNSSRAEAVAIAHEFNGRTPVPLLCALDCSPYAPFIWAVPERMIDA